MYFLFLGGSKKSYYERFLNSSSFSGSPKKEEESESCIVETFWISISVANTYVQVCMYFLFLGGSKKSYSARFLDSFLILEDPKKRK
jgi:hypothetical protein